MILYPKRAATATRHRTSMTFEMTLSSGAWSRMGALQAVRLELRVPVPCGLVSFVNKARLEIAIFGEGQDGTYSRHLEWSSSGLHMSTRWSGSPHSYRCMFDRSARRNLLQMRLQYIFAKIKYRISPPFSGCLEPGKSKGMGLQHNQDRPQEPVSGYHPGQGREEQGTAAPAAIRDWHASQGLGYGSSTETNEMTRTSIKRETKTDK